jgi:hypothetical protein
MGLPLTPKQMKQARVHPGEHLLCYRCDSFEKNHDGTCEMCGLIDRIGACVREWCPYCKRAELSDYYSKRCTKRTPLDGERIRKPIVGPLVDPMDMGLPAYAIGPICTYAILCGSHVKIGKSKNVAKRLAQLQTATPLPPQLLSVVHGDCEKNVHRHLECRGVKRTNGEWFEYNDETASILTSLGFSISRAG